MSSKSILLVEDDIDIREAVTEVLEAAGFDVWTATNGREALDLLDGREPPQLIFLDLMMPLMNGREFLKALRNFPERQIASIPVVVLTASGESARTDISDFTEFLNKPASLDAILDTARRYCA